MGYNVSNDDIYEEVADSIMSRPQIVKMDEQHVINDTECQHETLVADPNDTIGSAVYHGCANPKCGRGWYIQK